MIDIPKHLLKLNKIVFFTVDLFVVNGILFLSHSAVIFTSQDILIYQEGRPEKYSRFSKIFTDTTYSGIFGLKLCMYMFIFSPPKISFKGCPAEPELI